MAKLNQRQWRGHVQADMSDRDPGDEGWVRCFKCQAKRDFRVGPRGGIHYTRWQRENGTPGSRCEAVPIGVA